MSKVQSVLVPINKFSLTEAIRWLEENEFENKKVDITKNFYRFRQFEPSSDCTYRIKKLPNGIEFVLCFKK